eukprot:TRINITY_DN9088_c0_g1_i4.p1 TRINITY_DN9088_c0_g1~~TRINITY_DN9088_c0_g1_i4.p1  ORF type:complete len:304 (+),score=45.66 TRINITY_DN9088_c0_g1_i4:644-1555(+)
MGQCLGSQAHYNINNRNVVVKRRLGEGGFSYVELVHEAATSSIFAMKRMACTDDEELEAAKREIAMYQAFNHPNLIRVIDHDVVQSKVEPGAHEVCALFPAYQKGSLQDLIESHRADGSSIPEPMILRYVKDVCLALQHIHDHKPQGMCHRDVKPANVLLSDQDEPILMDFGSMTKAVVHINSRQEAIREQDKAAEHSSLPYRAPELIDVDSQCTLDTKTDVWSIGVMLYTLAYHDTPFERLVAHGGSLPLAIAQGRIEYPSNNEAFTEEYKALIESIVIVDPQLRPTMTQVIQAINKQLQTY